MTDPPPGARGRRTRFNHGIDVMGNENSTHPGRVAGQPAIDWPARKVTKVKDDEGTASLS
jgi:hypothetical protein